MCDCSKPSFDILIGDYDYTQELGDIVLNPKGTGTRYYKAFQVS